MKILTAVLALSSSFASGEIIIHNNRIEDAVENLGHWIVEEVNSKSFGKLARALLTANSEAKVKNLEATTHIFEDLEKLFKSEINMGKKFVPDTCNESEYAKCMTQP